MTPLRLKKSPYHSADSVKFRIFAPESFFGTLFATDMNFIPQYYKTHPLSLLVKLESVMDKHGNLRYAVTLSTGEKENVHYLFEHLDSALDFIHSNFG